MKDFGGDYFSLERKLRLFLGSLILDGKLK